MARGLKVPGGQVTQQLMGLFGSMREEAALRYLVSGRTSIVHVVHQSGDGVSHFIHTGVTKTVLY